MVQTHLTAEFMIKAPVNKIIPFSNVDGPGNRFAIFFQNCPFQCLFCHNPETINPCTQCGRCVETCPNDSLRLENETLVYKKESCIHCDTCIKICPNLSSPKVEFMGVNDILKQLETVRPYIRGITVSGGESMTHAKFLLELFREVKKLGLTCFIDSNGYYDFKEYDDLLNITDGVMLDVKAVNPIFHQKITNGNNKTVLENLNYLLQKNKLYEVRTVIFPKYKEENEETISMVSNIIKDQSCYKLLKYRHFGVREEGIHFYGMQSPEIKEMEKLAQLAIKNGANNVIIV